MVHHRGQLLTFWGIFDSVLNFQYATPRGLIHLLTVGCNYPLFGHFGFSSKMSICYAKGAHSFPHRWLQLLTFWGILDSVSNCQYATPRVRFLNFAAITHKSVVVGSIVIGLVAVGYESIVVGSVVFGPLSLDPLLLDLW